MKQTEDLTEKETKVLGTLIFWGFVFVALYAPIINHQKTVADTINSFLPVALVIITFAISQIFHEFGHYFAHKLNNRETKIVFSKMLPVETKAWDTKEKPFTSSELKRASWLGVFVGLIPIWIYALAFHNIYYLLILDVFYLYASRFDLKDVLGDKLFIFKRQSKKVLT